MNATVPIRIAAIVAPLPAGARLRREQPVEAVHPLRALEQHEESEEGDRDRPEHDRDHALGDRERRAGEAEHLRRPTLVDRVLDPLGQVIFRLQEPEPSLALADVVDVVGDLVDQFGHLVDDRRHEERSDPRERGQHEQEGHARGQPAPLNPVTLEEVDRRVHRQREEERDQNPDNYVPRDHDHLEHDGHGDDRAEHDQDRAHGKADEPLRHHATRIAGTSDGQAARSARMRTE